MTTSPRGRTTNISQRRLGRLGASNARSDHREVLLGADNDCLTTPTTKVQVKGTSHAYRAIAEGTSILVKCVFCESILQIGPTAKLLYCTNCSEVTPIEMAKEAAANLTGGGGDDGQLLDGRIAQGMQQNETDLAQARKLAKMGGRDPRS